ncbi:MAG: NHL repeat-containing protein [Planctomycetota bacterium]|nr:NHL repeat-containing protein [Planctomycetota bacterium]
MAAVVARMMLVSRASALALALAACVVAQASQATQGIEAAEVIDARTLPADRPPLQAKSIGVINGIRGASCAVDAAGIANQAEWLVGAESGLWSIHADGTAAKLEGWTGPVRALARCPGSDGGFCLAVDSRNRVHTVTIKDGAVGLSLSVSPPLAGPITAIACDGVSEEKPASLTIAAATRDGVTIWAGDGTVLWSSTPGEDFGRPGGLAFGDDGTLYVTDADRATVTALDRTGRMLARQGSRGSFPGQFKDPRGVAVQGGLVYLADRLNHRIVRLRPDLSFTDFWGMHAVWPRAADGATHYPIAVAISLDGTRALVVEPFERRVQRFETEQERLAGLVMPSVDGVQSHFGPSVDAANGRLVAFDPEGGAIVVFLHTMEQPVHVTTIGMPGTPMSVQDAARRNRSFNETVEGPGRFGRVKALAISPQGDRVLVADDAMQTLSLWEIGPTPEPLRFDPFLARLLRVVQYSALETGRVADLSASGDGWAILWFDEVVDPAAVARVSFVDRGLRPISVQQVPLGEGPATRVAVHGDELAVLCPVAQEVIVAGPSGVRSIHLPAGTEPTDVFAIAGGYLVTDASEDQLLALAVDGAPAATLGSTGLSDGRFWSPDAVTQDELGTIVVVDGGNHRLQKLIQAEDGSLQWVMTFSLGRVYTRPRNLDAPKGDGE